MMGVDLYIEVSSKRIKPGKASFCYVLEYISPAGNTYTKSEIGCIELPEKPSGIVGGDPGTGTP